MLEIANFALSSVTAMAALYIAFVALRHTAKPKLRVTWQRGSQLPLTPQDTNFIFDVFNVGHWYGKPTAKEVVIEFDFPEIFGRVELRCGSSAAEVTDFSPLEGGVGRRMIKSPAFTLHAYEGARFVVTAKWIGMPMNGNSNITIRAVSHDGAALIEDFPFLIVPEFGDQPFSTLPKPSRRKMSRWAPR